MRTRWRMESDSRLTTTSKRSAVTPSGRERPGWRQVVDGAQVAHSLEAGVAEGGHHRLVGVALREGQLVHQAVGQPRHVGEDDGWAWPPAALVVVVTHRGVATRTASGTVGTQPPVACSPAGTEDPGRRVISPVRIFSCSVRMACRSVSGDGGQPGA